VAERRELAVLVWDLSCGKSLDEPSVVRDEEILIATSQVEHRDRLEQDGGCQGGRVPLTPFGCVRRAETLLRPRRHVHLRVLSGDAEWRTERANNLEELRVFQPEQHGTPRTHRDASNGATVAGRDCSISAVHVFIDAICSLPSDALGTLTTMAGAMSLVGAICPVKERPGHDRTTARVIPIFPMIQSLEYNASGTTFSSHAMSRQRLVMYTWCLRPRIAATICRAAVCEDAIQNRFPAAMRVSTKPGCT
jgi:hypothetical protein